MIVIIWGRCIANTVWRKQHTNKSLQHKAIEKNINSKRFITHAYHQLHIYIWFQEKHKWRHSIELNPFKNFLDFSATKRIHACITSFDLNEKGSKLPLHCWLFMCAVCVCDWRKFMTGVNFVYCSNSSKIFFLELKGMSFFVVEKCGNVF